MNILLAYQLAAKLHAAQADKAGRPYIEHLSRVFIRVLDKNGTRSQQIAALLHDSIEDGKATKESLLQVGVPPEVVQLVVALTRPPRATYQEYLHQVINVPGAALVKFEDLRDNSDPSRLSILAPEDAHRLAAKYRSAMDFLLASGVSDTSPQSAPSSHQVRDVG